MLNPAKFVRETRIEISKVVWPTRRETMISTLMIMVLLLISALFFLLIDNLSSMGVKMILGLGA
jgi:preprotein translocase subunit SecE